MRPARWFAPIPVLAALVGVITVVSGGLQEFGFSDYEGEALPAVDRLLAGDLGGFLSRLPGYPGAVLIHAPFALLGGSLGGDVELWAWRFQALPGLALLLALGAGLGTHVARRVGGTWGTVSGALAAGTIAGSPLAMRAEMVGHPEELLVTGMAVGAVLLAVRGRLGLAGALVGLAVVAKPWAVLAVPVVLLAAGDRRELRRTLVPMVVAAALLAAPALLAQGVHRGGPLAHAGTGAIFKPAQAFWFFGPENASWMPSGSAPVAQYDVVTAPYAQRLAVDWASRVSHPLIVLVAFAMALAYGRARRSDRRDVDLLLVLAAVLWWRCVLDTWNADYYALGALVALAAWEAARGRAPVLAIAATVATWETFRGVGAFWHSTPDAFTALYLGWAMPLGAWLVWRALAPAQVGRVAARLRRARPAFTGRRSAADPA